MNTSYSFTEDRGVFRPTIPIAIINPNTGKVLISDGLIDSGAEVTVFPMNFFNALGLDVKKDSISNSNIYGVSGEATKVWIYPTDVMILEENSNIPFERVPNVMVHCIDSSDSIILLGTNFFSPKFKITLDYLNKTVFLEC